MSFLYIAICSVKRIVFGDFMKKIFFLAFFIYFSVLNQIYSQKITNYDTIKSYQELGYIIDQLVSKKNFANSRIGISIYSLKNKKFIYNYNQNELLVPASVTKLFTTFFALNLLYNDPFIKTTIYTDAKEIKSTLEGNIYIYGRGDGLLSLNDLDYIVENLKNLGIKKLKGNIYADGSFFDGQTSRFAYSGDLDEVEYVPPITALSINRNSGMLIVSAGSVPGRPASIQILPTSAAFSIVNNVKVIGNNRIIKKKKTKVLFDNPEKDLYFYEQKFGDKRRKSIRKIKGLSIQTHLLPNGRQVIQVSGSIYLNSNQKHEFKILSPEMVVAGAFFERLKASGIEIVGDFGIKKLDNLNKFSTLTEFQRDLCSFIAVINKNSDNFLAENLFKIIGATFQSDNNNKSSTIKFYNDVCQKLNININEVIFNDGSGLSRRNRTTAQTVVELLIKAAETNFSDCFGKSLAIAGVDGTLKKRLVGTFAHNNLIAKTGTHKNVSALAGYVNSLDGDTLAFAVLSNGWAVGEYKILENNIGELLSLLYIQ